MVTRVEHFIRAARLAELESKNQMVVHLEGNSIVLFLDGGKVYAVDNRCPHMGFPLHRGNVTNGILTCHWHHARFDLASGGTFDLFADDVRAFPVQLRGEEVWVDLAAHGDPRAHQRQRLREGLEHDIPLVLAKSTIALLEAGESPAEPLRIGLKFGTRHRETGWGQGLTILSCLSNLLPYLDKEDVPRALFQGLAAVARDCRGEPPRFPVAPLPTSRTDPKTLKQWFRQFVEVRDAEGAERCLVSAVRAGADHKEMTDLLFAAATDHRYIRSGHVVDFTNKALESLDFSGWEYAEEVLPSLAHEYAAASRMEEANSWRHPIDLVAILEDAFEELPSAIEKGKTVRGKWASRAELVKVVLGENPHESANALLDAVRSGASEVEIAAAVAYAAALRIARFHTSNEFPDWDTALHTYSFANAVHQGLKRSASPELLRGVFDAAMSIYLDRFLNVPPARIPEGDGSVSDPVGLLRELEEVMDKQQQVNQAGALVAEYLAAGADPDPLIARLGKVLLREDRDFHTIQTLEASVRQFQELRGSREGAHVLIAAARYMAAHFPTVRAQEQTYTIAARLGRGERLYGDDEEG